MQNADLPTPVTPLDARPAANNISEIAPLFTVEDLPLGKLSPDKFEAFAFACLREVETSLGVVIDQGPSGSSDQGFDVQGRSATTGRIVCIQCKRLQASLGLPLLAEELAKVAANSFLENSDVGEHWFICTGGVTQSLRQQLRERDRTSIAEAAVDRIRNASNGELARLRSRLLAIEMDPTVVVRQYVRDLDRLIAWDTPAFSAVLTRNWQAVLAIAEQFFRVEALVREHPRAQFDRERYVEAHRTCELVVRPRVTDTPIPDGLALQGSSDLRTSSLPKLRSIEAIEDLARLTPGELAILTGDGGIGKSTALELIRAIALDEAGETTLPIIVRASRYDSNWLHRNVEAQLGVLSGTWRTLPDRVLILFDGINECSIEDARYFLKDLQPLLEQKRIACVLTTRNLHKHQTLILPSSPTACVGLLSLSPNGIRKIALSELPDQEVVPFVEAYEALLNRSYTTHLWTPFAVLAALRVWKSRKALPDTLGTMLQDLLSQRALREAEASIEALGTRVVLQFAGAMAFELLVREGRLDCSGDTAAGWIQRAKARSGDAFGISEMSSSALVNVLTQHELLRRTMDGDFSLGHQITAGALAAPTLAKNWRNCLDTLHYPVADDAWVFAAPFVDSTERQDYLRKIFQVDVLLGARAARECSVEDRLAAERHLIGEIDNGPNERTRTHAVIALAHLQTPNALNTIRTIVNKKGENSALATRALALCGDEESLSEQLELLDFMRSAPLGFSGGASEDWALAPISTRVKLARKRLSKMNPGLPVAESLRTLSSERDPADADLIERHLVSAKSPQMWAIALRSLRLVAAERAQLIFEKTLEETSPIANRALHLRIGANVGVDVSFRAALDCITSDFEPSSLDFRERNRLDELVEQVLAANLPPDLIPSMLEALKSSDGDRRRRLWLLASYYPLEELALYALQCIGTSQSETVFGFQYFLSQPDVAIQHRAELLPIIRSIMAGLSAWHAPERREALLLGADVGLAPEFATLVVALIDRFLHALRSIEAKDLNHLNHLDIPGVQSAQLDMMEFSLTQCVASYVELVGKYRDVLPTEVLLSLLHFDMRMYSGMVVLMRTALQNISDEELDTALRKLDHPLLLLFGFCVASDRALTTSRAHFFRILLAYSYSNLSLMTSLTDCLKSCWDPILVPEILSVLVETPEWPEHADAMFDAFAKMVSERMSSAHISFLENALNNAKTEYSKRVLRLWLDFASRDRVGIIMAAAGSKE